MAWLEQLDGASKQARRKRIAIALNVAARFVEGGNVIPKRMRFMVYLALLGVSNKFDPDLRRGRGRPPIRTTAKARQKAIEAIAAGARPKMAINDALGPGLDDLAAYARIARAARRAKAQRTKTG